MITYEIRGRRQWGDTMGRLGTMAHSWRRALVATLAELREQRALSLSELAELSGVPPATIHGVERGHVPHPRTRRLLAKALGLAPNEIDWPTRQKPALPDQE